MSEAEDRTEAPSQQRLQKAREEGQVVVSRELLSLSILLSGAISIFIILPYTLSSFMHDMSGFLSNSGNISLTLKNTYSINKFAINTGIKLFIPLSLLTFISSLGLGLLQTNFLIHPTSLLPKLSRVSPLEGIKKIISTNTVIESLKTLLKFIAFSISFYIAVKSNFLCIKNSTNINIQSIIKEIIKIGFSISLSAIAVQAVIAGIDIIWMRYRHTSKLKMSREEIKEEYRNTEGDPHVKGRLKQMRAQKAKRRMMEAVKNATVIVTNPTHYAVALIYEKGSNKAPKIIAKGTAELATRIREKGQDHHIPIISNPPLARALYPLPLDSEIPLEHFEVVAAIIAYVWKLQTPNKTYSTK